MVDSKVCFKCGLRKSISEFYRHPQMADGHVNKCKECNKRDVRENRERKSGYYREYDRERGSRRSAEDARMYREKNKKKARASRMVKYHLAKGNLEKRPCEVCGSTEHIHAHHDDYSKPLSVRWLCAKHHHQWHKINGEGKNG